MNRLAQTHGGLVGRHGRSRTACAQCRRAKVRCEMQDRPCVRCSRLGIDCSLHSTASTTARRVPNSGAFETRANRSPSLPPAEAAPERVADASPSPSTFEVNGLSLPHDRARQLFQVFFEKYHPYLPFLDPSRTFLECYHASIFLFWAIISVSARDQVDGESILSELSPFFTTTIGQLFVGCKHNYVELGDVQALILLTLWPWVNVYWWTDRSRVLAQVSVTLAIQIGLHVPNFWTEYGIRRPERSHRIRDERVRTWCACVAVAQNMESDFGFFSTVPFSNAAIRAACRATAPANLADALRHYLLIQSTSHAALSLLELADRVENSESFSRNLASTLPESERLLCGLQGYEMSLFNRLNLVASEMHVQCMYFQVSPEHQQRKFGILRAYASARKIIELAVSESGRPTYTLYYAPRTLTRMLLCAALVLFKVLHSRYGIEISYDVGKLLFNAATTCIYQQAVRFRDQDTPTRFANFLRSLWDYGEAHPELLSRSPSTFAVKTRGGVSLIYDYLAMVRDEQGSNRSQDAIAAEGLSASNGSSGYLPVQSDSNGAHCGFGLFDWIDAEFEESFFGVTRDFSHV